MLDTDSCCLIAHLMITKKTSRMLTIDFPHRSDYDPSCVQNFVLTYVQSLLPTFFLLQSLSLSISLSLFSLCHRLVCVFAFQFQTNNDVHLINSQNQKERKAKWWKKRKNKCERNFLRVTQSRRGRKFSIWG